MSLATVTELPVHEDGRGRVVELIVDRETHTPGGRQVILTTARPGQVKGNHYHLRKTEWFVVVSGTLTMVLRERATGRQESLSLDASRPQLVEVPPGITHALHNDGDVDAVVVVYVSEVFDRDDPDTHAETLLSVGGR